MGKYKLICMSFDGDYQTETPPRYDGRAAFDTIPETWEFSNDMGSRWFFYPFHFVVTASGRTIADPPWGLEFYKGKRVKTVAREFAELAAQEEMRGADPDAFVLALQDLHWEETERAKGEAGK